MSSAEQRARMAKAILDFEARRDKQRRLVVYKLPKGDGGGRYEVAGINEKYNKEVCDRLVALIEAGQHDKAEALAIEFIANNTDVVVTWSRSPAVEFYLRDGAFNRGHAGVAKILQMALGLTADGVVGPKTRAVLAVAEQNPAQLLLDLRAARERYEREVVGRKEGNKFWKGLVNRWNNALKFAQGFLAEAPAEPVVLLASALPASFQPVPPAAMPSAISIDVSLPIPALRLGSTGPLVRAWKAFLIGEGFVPGEPNEIFDEQAVAATKAFQEKHALDADGVAGRQTIRKALARGFELIEEPAGDITGSNFPPRPSFPPLVTNPQRQGVFGAFNYVAAPTPKSPERIRILGTWERDNIVAVPIPQFEKTGLGSKAPKKLYFHKLAAAQLQGLWKAWDDAGLLDRIISFGGAFVPRFVIGSNKVLSNHAFGSAFDINVAWNLRGHRPALVGQKGVVRELVPLAHRWGFYWGGHFSNPDGMHFEIAVLK